MKATRLLLLAVLAALGVFWLGWEWGFCRFYVPPGYMAVIVAKEGKPLPPGQLLADRGQKGVQNEVLGEGRHFLNPINFEHRIVRATTIPAGKVGVVTSKVGKDLPPGEFLAQPGEKGIWRGVLGPGRYRLNPYGYQIDIIDAISIPIGYVGVVTSLAGQKAPEGGFAGPDQKGIRGDILQPGLYYVNPKQYKIDVLEVGLNQVSMQGKAGGAVITKGQITSQNRAMDQLQLNALQNQAAQREEYVQKERMGGLVSGGVSSSAPAPQAQQKQAPGSKSADSKKKAADPQDAVSAFVLNQFVGFPSRDGFDISLDMTVEFELQPDRIARIFRDYGDLPAVVEKIILPQILSVSRLKGSAYRAVDFIVGEGREKFQSDLTEALKRSLAERDIVVHNALIRHVDVPSQILDPIQQASIAVEQDLTNREKQNTARKQGQLNTEVSLIEQRGAEVVQETAKLKAEIGADKEKKVAEIQAGTLKQVAELDNQAAGLRAEKIMKIGRAQASALESVEGERAKGFQMKVSALGDASAFNLAEFARALNPDLRVTVIHAGSGTLWTDLQRATTGDLGGAKLLQQPSPAK